MLLKISVVVYHSVTWSAECIFFKKQKLYLCLIWHKPPMSVRCLSAYVQNDRYTVGNEEMFDTLTDLVEFYKRKGIEEISGNWVHFKQVNVCALVAGTAILFG